MTSNNSELIYKKDTYVAYEKKEKGGENKNGFSPFLLNRVMFLLTFCALVELRV